MRLLKHKNIFTKGTKTYTKNIYTIISKVGNGFLVEKITNNE